MWGEGQKEGRGEEGEEGPKRGKTKNLLITSGTRGDGRREGEIK